MTRTLSIAVIPTLVGVLAGHAAANDAAATAAQPGEVAQASVALPPVIEVPFVSTAPIIGAPSNELSWAGAAIIPALSLSRGPQAAGLTPPSTQVRLMWDAEFLYARFECEDASVYAPHGGGESSRDKPHHQGDVVEIFLDPRGDARAFLELQVSPSNGVLDGWHLLTAEARSNADGTLVGEVTTRDAWFFPEWNMPDLKSAIMPLVRGNQNIGWIAEIALPAKPLLARLGLRKWQPMTLRANFLRYDADLPPKDQKTSSVALNWAPVEWGRPHRSPQAMGILRLLPPPASIRDSE